MNHRLEKQHSEFQRQPLLCFIYNIHTIATILYFCFPINYHDTPIFSLKCSTDLKVAKSLLQNFIPGRQTKGLSCYGPQFMLFSMIYFNVAFAIGGEPYTEDATFGSSLNIASWAYFKKI